MPEPLRVIEALGREIERVTAQPARRRRPARTLLIAVAVLLGLTGAAGATSYVLTGSPIPGAPEQDVPIDQRLEPGTARLAGAEADDPGGGPKWDLRVSRSQTGELCTAVGQVSDGVFGLVGLDGRFRELPVQGVDACGSDPEARPAFIGAREFAADRPEDRRTVVNGVGGDELEDVEIEGAEVARGDGGTFVAVFRGGVDQARPTVRLRFEDGTRREYRFGQSRYVEAPDPEGKEAWTVRADPRNDGRHCAQARGALLLGPMNLTPPVCGTLRRDHVFFDVRPFAATFRERYSWSGDPRTLVYGAADETVEKVEVAHAGKRVTATRTEADPGFVAVLPAGTRPAEVEVTVVFADGRRETVRGAHNLRDSEGNRLERPLLEPPDPDPRAIPRPDRFEPIPGSEKIVARERLAGLRLALRTSRNGDGPCAELGWLAEDGTFGARDRAGRVHARPLGRMGPLCRGTRLWAQLLDDGRAYDPRVIGTYVMGYADPGAHVEVRDLGPPLETRADAHGLFLMVTERTERPRAGVDIRLDGRSTSNPGFTPSPVVPGSLRIAARAPDPSGLQPYGLLEWKQSEDAVCAVEGPLVGDITGSVNPEGGTFFPYPMYEGASCGPPPTGGAVSFGVSRGGGERPGERTETETARRVLPGRTIVKGRAGPDVRRVILQTPRDVRAFRPGPGGAFLVVYDGTFSTGTVTVIAELANGRTTRQTMDLDP